MSMVKPPDRRPRPPRLAVDPEPPEVAGEVFVDEAIHRGLRLEGVRCSDVEAEKVELKNFVLTEVDLSEAKLDRLDLEDGSINICNLANLRSQSCTLDRIEIEGSRLTGATLVEPRLVDVVFRDSLLDLSSFRFGHLKRVRFEGCRLSEADFQGVVADACAFIDCDLTGAQLSHGSFEGCAFRGCRLVGVGGPEALRGAHMASQDVMELATAWAMAIGIEVRDDIG